MSSLVFGCVFGNGLQRVSVCLARLYLAVQRCDINFFFMSSVQYMWSNHELNNIVRIATRIEVPKMHARLFFVCVCVFFIPCAPDCVVDVAIVGGCVRGNGLQSVSVCSARSKLAVRCCCIKFFFAISSVHVA